MANMPNLILECHFCSTRFQSLTQNLGHIFNLPQPYENAWLFDRFQCVLGRKSGKSIYDIDFSCWSGGSTRMTLTNVSCSGCGTPCGLKIVTITIPFSLFFSFFPLRWSTSSLRRGQYIL
ncbi:hypothetical protein AAG906_011379 [Vitis piasezkii]